VGHKYDLFISHASEDKDFVRPLAQALRAQRLAVWFDEFELRPGMGLRESIDRGLLESQFGLIVLSPSFFAKSWPRWELDGLVQLAHLRSDSAILPIWHHVDHVAVAAFSPPLANIIAIPSADDPVQVAAAVLNVLRPRPTAVEVARSLLDQFGFPAPVLSDDWWLDAAAWSASPFGEGTFQEASSWGWWGFPLPPLGDSAESKGERIAWAAMQHSWQEAAEVHLITPCSHPSDVEQFLLDQPGLAATAEAELDCLLWFVPQLGIPGCGGFLESQIQDVFDTAAKMIRTKPDSGSPGWVLRDSDFCGQSPEDLASLYFWPSSPSGNSPDANVVVWIDAAAWLMSSASDWLPTRLKGGLREGLLSEYVINRLHDGRFDLREVTVGEDWNHVVYHGPSELSQDEFRCAAAAVLPDRLAASCEAFGLPESGEEIANRIVAWGALDKYWSRSQRMRGGK
jgi:hypothetical protein